MAPLSNGLVCLVLARGRGVNDYIPSKNTDFPEYSKNTHLVGTVSIYEFLHRATPFLLHYTILLYYLLLRLNQF